VSRILMPLAAGYRLGTTLRSVAYRRGWLKTRRLGRPVISVGNLTAGGTGKTPLVAYVAELLLKRGLKPSILTRGYKRQSRERLIAVEPAAERAPDPRQIGDEPALLARKLPQVPIMVSADRYGAGCLAESQFNVDTHILDDGFQHWALARDVDIVVLDATQDLSGAELLPAGRLREPLEALQRAGMIILSRTELADPAPVESLVRRIAPQATVFHAATQLCELVDVNSGRIYPASAYQGEPVYAFCGIGNPKAFFDDLKSWGFHVAGRDALGDHHRYGEVDQITMMLALKEHRNMKASLTTEKDAQNLRGTLQEAGGIPILACVIRAELREAEAFDAELLERLRLARAKA
jgi:tetraacyldisaccharide 4'-kinase